MREYMNYVDVQADKCQNKLKWRVIPEAFRVSFRIRLRHVNRREGGQTQMRFRLSSRGAD